jgi:hypothetical protein
MPAIPELPLVATSPLSVVLLVGDATDAGAVVRSWLDFLARRPQEHELLLVDAGGGLPAGEQPGLRLVEYAGPRGEGAALRAALAQARHPLVFYTLCHPDYRPEHLEKLLDRPFTPEDSEEGPPEPGKEIDHVHLMSGYRAGVKVPWPLRALGLAWRIFCRVAFSYAPPPLPGWLGWRRHLGWLLVRIFFGLRYRDVACPFRLFRRDILPRMPIQSDGPFAHVEMLAKANFLGCLMGEEMPLDVKPGPYRGDFRQMWREAKRVFNDPDFGPAVLPAAPSPGEQAAQPGQP